MSLLGMDLDWVVQKEAPAKPSMTPAAAASAAADLVSLPPPAACAVGANARC